MRHTGVRSWRHIVLHRYVPWEMGPDNGVGHVGVRRGVSDSVGRLEVGPCW